jgi:hypothetical protein
VDQAPFDKPTEDLIVASMGRLKDAISFAVKETRAAGQAELIWMTYFGGRVIVKSGASKTTLKAIKQQVLDLL